MDDYLAHHGTKGMKWGVRRYQNADGTLTPAGKKRYGQGASRTSLGYDTKHDRAYRELHQDLDRAKSAETRSKDAYYKSLSKASDESALGRAAGLAFGNRSVNRVLKKGGYGLKERGAALAVLRDDAKSSKAFNKWMNAEENRKATEARLNKTMSELNMGKKELAYRSAGYEYAKYLLGDSKQLATASGLGGFSGSLGYMMARDMTKEGKRLKSEYKSAKREYKKETKELKRRK